MGNRNHRTGRQARRWGVGAGMAAAAAAAMIGMSTAHADTPDQVMDQAVQYLNQGTSALDAADTADLSTRQLGILTDGEGLNQQLEPLLTQIGTAQESLSAADQGFLANADEQFVSAAQSMLSADQAFVAADQAGDLSGSSLNSADLTLLDGALGLLSADVNVGGATLFAAVDPDIGTIAAASAAATTTDPADLLSEATTNFTDANQLLAEIPSGEFWSVGIQTMLHDDAVQTIGALGPDESALSSLDNGALADFLSPWFASVDQGWYQASEAVLSADQTLETAAANGSADASTALLGTLAADAQTVVPELQSEFIDVLAHVSGADLTSGLDPVTALDPSVLADLLSSIGL